MMTVDVGELKKIAARIRGRLVEMSHKAETPHLGGSLSCVDILVAAYWGVLNIDPKKADDPKRDRFIFSKGHAATALYTALAFRGFVSPSLLDTYAEPGSPLCEHPGPRCIPGVEAATGSLGHGLPIAVGMALAARIKDERHRVFALMSDGECNEGSVWEAAMFAAGQHLGALTAIVDYNKWQATGRSNEVMALSPLKSKWEAFGWRAVEVDGHDLEALQSALGAPSPADGQPLMIVAHTVKGKGISFMEDDNNWHYRVPTEEEVVKAKKELGLL